MARVLPARLLILSLPLVFLLTGVTVAAAGLLDRVGRIGLLIRDFSMSLLPAGLFVGDGACCCFLARFGAAPIAIC